VESPYYFPEMDRLSAPADQALEERPAADLAPLEISLPPLPTIPGCTMLRPGDTDYAAHTNRAGAVCHLLHGKRGLRCLLLG
jgi:hypothetical protein